MEVGVGVRLLQLAVVVVVLLAAADHIQAVEQVEQQEVEEELEVKVEAYIVCYSEMYQLLWVGARRVRWTGVRGVELTEILAAERPRRHAGRHAAVAVGEVLAFLHRVLVMVRCKVPPSLPPFPRLSTE